MLDFARFALATAVIAMAGVGTSVCLQVPLNRFARILTAPVFGQALVAIAIGSGIRLGMPVRTFAPWLWGVLTVLAAFGLRRILRESRTDSGDTRSFVSVVATAGLVPVFAMLPYFRHGLADYPGSGLPDGWSYIAYGQYLWDFPAGAEGGLAPLYQFASTLIGARNASGGELGLLAMLRATGDVQTGAGLLQAVGLAAYASAIGAFALAAGMRRAPAIATIVAAVVSGWILNVLWANNFDNLLALGYAPAIAVLTMRPEPDSTGWWLGWGWLSAGLLQTYPDFGVAVLVCSVVAAVTAIARQERRFSTSTFVRALAALALLVLLMPSVRDLWQLLGSHQSAATASSAARPGEGMFTGLIVPRHVLAAWWALGSEHAFERLLVPRTCLALALTALLVVGIRAEMARRQSTSLVWLLLPLGVAPFLAIGLGYSYGAYKAILMGWWFMAFLVVSGASTLWSRQNPAVPMLRYVSWLIVAALPAAATARLLFAPTSRSFRMPRPASVSVFRQVREIESFINSDPIVLALHDEEVAEWAIYYTRNLNTLLFTSHRYLVPKADALARAQSVDISRARWVLADAPNGRAAVEHVPSDWSLKWQRGPYTLYATPPGAARSLTSQFGYADARPGTER